MSRRLKDDSEVDGAFYLVGEQASSEAIQHNSRHVSAALRRRRGHLLGKDATLEKLERCEQRLDRIELLEMRLAQRLH